MNGRTRSSIVAALTLAAFVVVLSPSSTRGDADPATTTTTIPSSCQPTTSTASGLPPAPSGVVAVDLYDKKQGTEPFPQPVFRDTSISGVDLAVGWDELEPPVIGSPPGVATPVQWAVLDCLFAEADQYGKFVILTMIPGFHTPSWALDGVDAPVFSFKYHEPPYPPPAALPEPWNQTYLNRWYTFLNKVAHKFDANREFEMVESAGPTSVSTEMSLPYGTGDPALKHTVITVGTTVVPVDGSDVLMWRALRYTPYADEAAWNETFNRYAHIFPDKYIALALTPGLPIGNASSTLVQPSPSDPSQRTATPLTNIAEGEHHRPQFVLQEDGLSAKAWPESVPDPEYNFVKANCGTVTTGYQTKNPLYEGDLQDVIDQGVAGGAKFLELYLSDVLTAPSAELATAAAKLKDNANCVPLRLRAVHTTASILSPVSVTATTTLNLTTGDEVNILESGRTLISCHSTTCHITTALANSTAIFTADVSYANQPPLVTVSAKTS